MDNTIQRLKSMGTTLTLQAAAMLERAARVEALLMRDRDEARDALAACEEEREAFRASESAALLKLVAVERERDELRQRIDAMESAAAL